MEIKLTQGQLVGLMVDKIKAHGTSKSGTYNKADPTHYERGEAKFELMYGYSESKAGDIPPPSEVVTARFRNSTWVVSFEFETSIGVIDATYDPDDKVWLYPSSKFEQVFLDVLFADPEGTREGDNDFRLMCGGNPE